jgi:16S rRNA G966 N2-methylase RsmD
MKENPQKYHNSIVELSLTYDKKWVPFRLREDKFLPNSYKVGLSTISIIFDQIKPLNDIYFQKNLTMSQEKLNIIHLINQTFRKYIIEKYTAKFDTNSSVIDLCGGRGADEFNLYSNGVSNFFVIDNDTTALKRYFDRTLFINNKKYEPLTTNHNCKPNWINLNLLKQKLDKNYDDIKKDLNSRYEFYKRKVDIVLMNYAIHYLCDDEEKIIKLSEFVNSVLFNDGIFIVTYFNGDEIIQRKKDNLVKIGPFDIQIIKEEKNVTIAKMPLPTIKEGENIYAEEPLVKQEIINKLETHLNKFEEFYVYDECKTYINKIPGFEEYIDYYKLIKVGIYRKKR